MKYLLPTMPHYKPNGFRDNFAYAIVKLLRFFADAFFAKRYGHRAIVLETIAAVPGMVGGCLLHLKSLRRMEGDHGWIKIFLNEAENERMHLMTFIAIEHPTAFERYLVIAAQVLFYALYFLLYVFSPKTAHRLVGYLEEEAVLSYTQYLELIDSDAIQNVPAPAIAVQYWGLSENATLRDVVLVVRADEERHRDVNHCMASQLVGEACDIAIPRERDQGSEERREGRGL